MMSENFYQGCQTQQPTTVGKTPSAEFKVAILWASQGQKSGLIIFGIIGARNYGLSTHKKRR
jgi:hypothetical protein